MNKTVKRNGILVEEEERKVGTVYEDEWASRKVRFHNHKKEKQQILHSKTLEEKIIRNDWSIDKIKTPSDSYQVVKETIVNHLCAACEETAMYDSDQDEFYCPGCTDA